MLSLGLIPTMGFISEEFHGISFQLYVYSILQKRISMLDIVFQHYFSINDGAKM